MKRTTPSKLIAGIRAAKVKHTWLSRLPKSQQRYVESVVREMRGNPDVFASEVAAVLVDTLRIPVRKVTAARSLREMLGHE